MNNYSLFVRFLAENKINRDFLNSDEDKMLTVFTEMFRQSKKEVRIFAGNLCNESTNSEQYIDAISDFIEANGKVRILLNSFERDCALDSNLFRRLAFYKNAGYDVIVKDTNMMPYITERGQQKYVHFSVGDCSIYRVEIDTELRRAICNMHNETTSKALADTFDKVFESDDSREINLIDLFDRKQ